MANRYSKNKFAITIIRPLWRLYHNYEYKRQVAKFHKNGLVLLSKFSELCHENQIVFWLDFGTLLGAWREHDFIEHDYDIDLGVMFEDRDKLQHVLENGGFSLIREFKVIKDNILIGAEQTYSFKSVMVDIFYYHKIKDDKIMLNSFTPILDDNNFKGRAEIKEIIMPYFGFDKYLFKGISVYIPRDTPNYLAYYYGNNYMVPDPNYDYKKIMRNIRYYNRSDKTAEFIEYKKLYI